MAIKAFILAFKNAWQKKNTWEMAQATFKLIWNLQAAGLLWMIIESVLCNMSKWDWFMTAAQVPLIVTATLATDGLALMAKISGAVLSAKTLIGLITDLH